MKKNRFSIFVACMFAIFCFAGVSLFETDFSNVEVAEASSPTSSVWDGSYPSSVSNDDFYQSGSSYYIYSAAGFAYFASTVNASSGYKTYDGCTIYLATDIDLNSKNFSAIGSSTKGFMGTFDGQGYTIYNLTAAANGSYTALFGFNNGGTIKNLTLFGVSTSGSTTYVAGLVAYNTGTISGCSVRGSVSSSGQYLGGIAAYSSGSTSGSSGKIEKSANFATVKSTYSSTAYVGGVAGYVTSTTVQQSYNSGTISASSGYDGGLVGYAASTTITNAYNAGSVTGGSEVGGIVGRAGGSVAISFCYNSGTSGSRGLVGGSSSSSSNSLTNSFDVSSYSTVPYTNVSASYVAYATSSTTLSTLQTLAKTSQFYQASTYTYFSSDWSTSVWTISASSYPQLDILNVSADENTSSGSSTFVGSGTQASPYLIYTAGDLALIATLSKTNTSYLSEYYMLMNDIDLTGLTWTPIGYYSSSQSNSFSGVFDGNNHTISGLTTSTQYASYGYFALFAKTSGAVIKNLIVEDCKFLSSSSSKTGILVGQVAGATYFVNVKCESTTMTYTSGSTATTVNAIGAINGGSVYVIYGKNNLSGSSVSTSTFVAGVTVTGTGYDITVNPNGGQISSATIDSSNKVTATSNYSYGEYHIIVNSSGTLMSVTSYQASLPEDIYKYKRDGSSFIGSIVVDNRQAYAFNGFSGASSTWTQSTTSMTLTRASGSGSISTLVSTGLTIEWTTSGSTVNPIIVTVYNLKEVMYYGAAYKIYSDSYVSGSVTSGLTSYTSFSSGLFVYSSSTTYTYNGKSLTFGNVYYDTSTGLLFKAVRYSYGTTYTISGDSTGTMREGYYYSTSNIYTNSTLSSTGSSENFNSNMSTLYSSSNKFSSIHVYDSTSTEAVRNKILYIDWQTTGSKVITISVVINTKSGDTYSYKTEELIDSLYLQNSAGTTMSYTSKTSSQTKVTYNFSVSTEYFLTSSTYWTLYAKTINGAYFEYNSGYASVSTSTHDTNFGNYTVTEGSSSYYYVRSSSGTYSQTTTKPSSSSYTYKQVSSRVTEKMVNFCGNSAGGTYTITLSAGLYEQEDSISVSGGYLGFGAKDAMTISYSSGTYSTDVKVSVNGATAVSLESYLTSLGEDAQTILADLYTYQQNGNSVYVAFDFLNGRILFSSDSLNSVACEKIALSNLSNISTFSVTIGSETYIYNVSKNTSTGEYDIKVAIKSLSESNYFLKVSIDIDDAEYTTMSYYTWNDFIFIGEVPTEYTDVNKDGYVISDNNLSTNAYNLGLGKTFTSGTASTNLVQEYQIYQSWAGSNLKQKVVFNFDDMVSATNNTLVFQVNKYVIFEFKFVDSSGNEISTTQTTSPEYFRFTTGSAGTKVGTLSATNNTEYVVTGLYTGNIDFVSMGSSVTASSLSYSSVINRYSISKTDSNSTITLYEAGGLASGIYTINLLCEETKYNLAFDKNYATYANYIAYETSKETDKVKTLYGKLTTLPSGVSVTFSVATTSASLSSSGTISGVLSSDTITISRGSAPAGYEFVGYLVYDGAGNYGLVTESDLGKNAKVNAVSTYTYSMTYEVLLGLTGSGTLTSLLGNGKTLTVLSVWTDALTTITLNLNDSARVGSADSTYSTVCIANNGSGFYASTSSSSTLEAKYLVPTLAGYTFAGWYNGSDSSTATQVIDKNGALVANASGYSSNSKWTLTDSKLTLYATWEEEPYTITYNLNGGTNSSSNPATYTIEDVITLEDPTRKGYIFAGWFDNSACEGTAVSVISESTGNLEFWASWVEVTYTIILDPGTGDGTQQTISNVEYNTVKDVTNPFTKSGYDFGGWVMYVDDVLVTDYASTTSQSEVSSKDAITNEGLYYVSTTVGQETIRNDYARGLIDQQGAVVKLVATWNLDTDNYFIVNLYYQNTSGDYDDSLSVLGEQVNGLYGFDIDISYSGKGTGSGAEKNTTVTIEAAIDVITGTTTACDWVTKTYFKTGFVVDKVEQTGTTVGSLGDTVVSIYFARIQYSLTFEYVAENSSVSNASSTVSELSVKANSSAVVAASGIYTIYYGASVEVAVTTADGYDFVSLQELSSTGTLASASTNTTNTLTMPNGDLQLQITTTPTVYTITYYSNGGTMSGVSVTKDAEEYSSTYTIEDAFSLVVPSRDGYEFKGWFQSSTFDGNAVSAIATGTTGDMELWAKWKTITYTITFILPVGTLTVANGIAYVEDGKYTLDYTIEDTITLPTPNLVGYDFDYYQAKLDTTEGNWGETETYIGDVSGMFGDVTLTSSNTAHVFVLDLKQTNADIEGSLYAQVTYDSSTVLYSSNKTDFGSMSEPWREGYNFEGWSLTQNGNAVLIDSEGILLAGVTLYYSDANYSTLVGYKYEDDGTAVYLDTNGEETGDLSSYYFVAYTNSDGEWIFDNTTTLYASWTPIEYYVSFSATEGSFTAETHDDKTATYDSALEVYDGSIVTRDGYDFAGWALLENDVYVYATVISKDDDGFYIDDSTHFSKAEALLEDYDVSGLYVYTTTDGNSTTTCYYIYNLTSTEGATVTLYAQWDVISTTLIFDLNDGTGSTQAECDVSSATIDYYEKEFSDASAEDIIPTREGYSFDGYYLGYDDEGTLVLTDKIIDSDGTLCPDVNGYTLSDGTWVWFRATLADDDFFTVYASWTALEYEILLDSVYTADNGVTIGSTSVTVTFDSDSLTSIDNPTKSIDNPTKTGYNFVGWFSAEDGGDLVIDENGELQANTDYTSSEGYWIWYGATVTLYAHYEARTDTTFTIKFILQGTHGNYDDDDADANQYATDTGTSDSEISITVTTIDSTRNGVTINGTQYGFEGFTYDYVLYSYDGTSFAEISASNIATISQFGAADADPSVPSVLQVYFARLTHQVSLTVNEGTGTEGIDSVTFTDVAGVTVESEYADSVYTLSVYYEQEINMTIVLESGYKCAEEDLTETTTTNTTLTKILTRSSAFIYTFVTTFNMPNENLSFAFACSRFVTAVNLNQNSTVTDGTSSASVVGGSTSMTYEETFVAPERTAYTFGGYWTTSDDGTTLETQILDENGEFCSDDVSGYIENGQWVLLQDDLDLYILWTLNDDIGEVVNNLSEIIETYDGTEQSFSIYDVDILTSTCPYIEISLAKGIVAQDGLSVDVDLTCDNSDCTIDGGKISIVNVGSYNFVLIITLLNNDNEEIASWQSSFTFTMNKATYSSIETGEKTKVNNAQLLMSSFVPESVEYSGETITLSKISTLADLAKFAKGLDSADSALQAVTDDADGYDAIYLYLITKYYLILSTTSTSDYTYRAWTYSDYLTYAEENSTLVENLSSVTYFYAYALDSSESEIELTGYDVSDLTINGVIVDTEGTLEGTYSATKISISGNGLYAGKYANLNMYVTDSNLIKNYNTFTSGDEHYLISYNTVLVVPYVLSLSNSASENFAYYDSSISQHSVEFVLSDTTEEVNSYTCQYVMDYEDGAIYVYVQLYTSGSGVANANTKFAYNDATNFIYASSVRFYYVDSEGEYQDLTSRIKFALPTTYTFTILRIDNVVAFDLEALYLTLIDDSQSLTSLSETTFTDSGITVSQITYKYYDYDDNETKYVTISVSTSGTSDIYSFSSDGTIFYAQRYSDDDFAELVENEQEAISITEIEFSVKNLSVSDYVNLYKWCVGDFDEYGVDGTYATTDSFSLDITDDETYAATTDSLLEKQIHAIYTDLVLVTFQISDTEIEGLTSNLTQTQFIKVGESTINDIYFPTLMGLDLETATLTGTGTSVDIMSSEGQALFFKGSNGEYVGFFSNVIAPVTFKCTWKVSEIEVSYATEDDDHTLTYSVGSLSTLTIDDFAVILGMDTSIYDYAFAWTSLGGSDTSNIETNAGSLSFMDGGTTKNDGKYVLTVTVTLNSAYAASLGVTQLSASSDLTVTLKFMPYTITNLMYWETDSSYDSTDKLSAWSIYVEYLVYDNDEQEYNQTSYTSLTYTTGGDITFEVKNSDDDAVTEMILPDSYTVSVIFAEGKFELSSGKFETDDSSVYLQTYDFAGIGGENEFEFEDGENYYTYDSTTDEYEVVDQNTITEPEAGVYYYVEVSLYRGYLNASGYFVGQFTYELSKAILNLQNFDISFSKVFNSSDPELSTTIVLDYDSPTVTFTREAGEDAGMYELYLTAGQNPYYQFIYNGYILCEDGELLEGFYYVGLGVSTLEEFEDDTTYYTYNSSTQAYDEVDTTNTTTPEEDVEYFCYGVLAENISVGTFYIDASTALRFEFVDSEVSLDYVAGGYEISFDYTGNVLSLKFTNTNGVSKLFKLKIYDIAQGSYIDSTTTINGYNMYSIILEAMKVISKDEEYDEEGEATGNIIRTPSITPYLYSDGEASESATSVGTYTIGFSLDYFENYYLRVDMLSTSTLTIKATEIDVEKLSFNKTYDGKTQNTFVLDNYTDLAISVVYSTAHVVYDGSTPTAVPVTLTLIYNGTSTDDDEISAYLQSFVLSSQTSTAIISPLSVELGFELTQSEYHYGDVNINDLASVIDTDSLTLTSASGNEVGILYTGYYELVASIVFESSGDALDEDSDCNESGYVYYGKYYIKLKDSTFNDFIVTNLEKLGVNLDVLTLEVTVTLPSDYYVLTTNDYVEKQEDTVTISQTGDSLEVVYSVVYGSSNIRVPDSTGDMLNAGPYKMALSTTSYLSNSIMLTMADSTACVVVTANETMYVKIVDSEGYLSQTYTGSEFTLSYDDGSLSLVTYEYVGELTTFDGETYYTYDGSSFSVVSGDSPTSGEAYYSKKTYALALEFSYYADANATSTTKITGVEFESISFEFNSTAKDVGSFYVVMKAGTATYSSKDYTQVVLSTACSFKIVQKEINVANLGTISVEYGTKTTTIEDFDEKVGTDEVAIVATFSDGSVGTGKTVKLALTGEQKSNYKLSETSVTTGQITQAKASISISKYAFTFGELTLDNFEAFLSVKAYVDGAASENGQLVSDAKLSTTIKNSAGTVVSKTSLVSTAGFIYAGTYTLSVSGTSANYTIVSNEFTITIAQYDFSLSDVSITFSYGDDLSSGVPYSVTTYYGETATFTLKFVEEAEVSEIGTYEDVINETLTYSDDLGNYALTISNVTIQIVVSTTDLYLLVDNDGTPTNRVSFTYDGNSYTKISIEYDDEDNICLVLTASDGSEQSFKLTIYYQVSSGVYAEYTGDVGTISDGDIYCSETIRNAGSYELKMRSQLSCGTHSVKFGFAGASSIYFYVDVTQKSVVFKSDGLIKDGVLSQAFTSGEAVYTFTASEVISEIFASDSDLTVEVYFTTDAAGEKKAVNVATNLYVWANLSNNYTLQTDADGYLLYSGSSTRLQGAITPAQLTFTASSVTFEYGDFEPGDVSSLSYTLSATDSNLSDYVKGLYATLSGKLTLSGTTTSTSGKLVVGDYTISINSFSDDNVEISTYVIDGGDPLTSLGTAWALTITAKELTVSGTVTKVYDGTDTASVSDLTLSGYEASDVVSIDSDATYEGTTAGEWLVSMSLTGADAGNYTLPTVYGTIEAIILTIQFDFNDVDEQNKVSTAVLRSEEDGYILQTDQKGNKIYTLIYPFLASKSNLNNNAEVSTDEHYFPEDFVSNSYSGHLFTFWTLNLTIASDDANKTQKEALISSLSGYTISTTTESDSTTYAIKVGNDSSTVALLEILAEDTYFGYYHGAKNFVFVANWEVADYEVYLQFSAQNLTSVGGTLASVIVKSTYDGGSSNTTLSSDGYVSVKYGTEVELTITTSGSYSTFLGIYENQSQVTGVSEGTDNSDGTFTYTYTIDSVSENHTLVLTFEVKTTTITYVVPDDASVLNSKNFSTTDGGKTYTWTADYFTISTATFVDLPSLNLPVGYEVGYYKVGKSVISEFTKTFEDYISDDLTLTVETTLSPKTYSIELVISSDTSKTITIKYGDSFNSDEDNWIDTPSIGDAYTFEGWYTEAEGGSQILGTSELRAASEDEIITILYAHWSTSQITVTITFTHAEISDVALDGYEVAEDDITKSDGVWMFDVDYASTLTFNIVAEAGYSISTDFGGYSAEAVQATSQGSVSAKITATTEITFTSTAKQNTVTLSGDNLISVTVTLDNAADPSYSWSNNGSVIVWDSNNTFTVATGVKVVIVATTTTGYVFTAEGLSDCTIDNNETTLTLTYVSISADCDLPLETTQRENTVTIALNDYSMIDVVSTSISGYGNDFYPNSANVTFTVLTGETAEITIIVNEGYEIYSFTSEDYTTSSNFTDSPLSELVLTISDVYADGTISVNTRIETFAISVVVLTYDKDGKIDNTQANMATITSDGQEDTSFSSVSLGSTVTLTASTTDSYTYNFTGWQISNDMFEDNPYTYTISKTDADATTKEIVIYALFSAASYSGELKTQEKVVYGDDSSAQLDVDGGTFADSAGESVETFLVFYGATVTYSVTLAEGYYLLEIGYFDSDDTYATIESYGTGTYEETVNFAISGETFSSNDVKSVVALVSAYSLTINVSTIINIDGYEITNEDVGTIELVDENGNSVDGRGYSSISTSRVQQVYTEEAGKTFNVVAYTGDVVYLKLTVSRDGYAIENLTLSGLDDVTLTTLEMGTNYAIYQLEGFVGSRTTSTHTAVAVFRPKLNAINLRMLDGESLVDAGGFVASDATGTEYQMVWSSASHLSSVQVSAYTDGVVMVVAYIRAGYVYADAITDSSAIVTSVKYEELSITETGFTGKVTLLISGFTSSSSVYVHVTAQTYTVVLKYESETLAKIANVSFGSILNLSQDNSANITILSDKVYFSNGVLNFSVSGEDYTFRGFFTEEGGSGTQYIDGDGNTTVSWAERGYSFDTINNQYVLSDNVQQVGDVLEVSLFAYETYLKTVITISVSPTVISNLTVDDVIEGTNPSNSWTYTSNPTSIEVAFNIDIRFVAPEIEGYSFYRFVISQTRSDGTALADVTSYSSSVPWSTNKKEDIVEVEVKIEYFAKVTVTTFGGETEYSFSQSNSDSQAQALLAEGYVDPTKSFTLTAQPADGYMFDHWVVVSTGTTITTTSLVLTTTKAIEVDLYVRGKTVTLNFASSDYVTDYGVIAKMDVLDSDGATTTSTLGAYGQTQGGTMLYQKTTTTSSVKVGDVVTFYVITDEGFGVTWNRDDVEYVDYDGSTFQMFSLQITASMANSTVVIIPTFTADTLSFYITLSFDEELEEAADGNDASVAGYVSVNETAVTRFTNAQDVDVVFEIVTNTRYSVSAISIENYNITYDDIIQFWSGSVVTIPTTYITANGIKGVVKMNVVFTRLLWEEVEAEMFEGSGTSSDPYLISTAEELALMLKLCNTDAENENGVKYRYCSYVLQDSIELTDRFWTPIGTAEYAFEGTFNFNRNAVNMVYFTTTTESSVYDGLFGVLGTNAKIITSETSTWWVYLTVGLGLGVAGFFVLLWLFNRRRKRRNLALRVK